MNSLANDAARESLWPLFLQGDVDAARRWLTSHEVLAPAAPHQAHPLLRFCVERNQGHCYKQGQMLIADLLLSDLVKSFRRSVLEEDLKRVRSQLQSDPSLVNSQFTAGRGIAQAIHHWNSIGVAAGSSAPLLPAVSLAISPIIRT